MVGAKHLLQLLLEAVFRACRSGQLVAVVGEKSGLFLDHFNINIYQTHQQNTELYYLLEEKQIHGNKPPRMQQSL